MHLRGPETARRPVLLWREVHLWQGLSVRRQMQLQAGMSYTRSVADTPPEINEAIVEALDLHTARLRAFVERRTSVQDVEDVLQAAAVRALEKANTLQDPSSALAWLYQIHRTTLADTGRRITSRRKWEVDDAEPCEASTEVSEGVIDQPCGCSAYQAGRLKASYAEILRLVDMEEYTIEEASRALGISSNNATVRLHRARAALRTKMMEHCGVSSASECADCRCAEDGCCAT